MVSTTLHGLPRARVLGSEKLQPYEVRGYPITAAPVAAPYIAAAMGNSPGSPTTVKENPDVSNAVPADRIIQAKVRSEAKVLTESPQSPQAGSCHVPPKRTASRRSIHKDDLSNAQWAAITAMPNSRATLGVVNRLPPEQRQVWAGRHTRATLPARGSMASVSSSAAIPRGFENITASPSSPPLASPTAPAVSSSVSVAKLKERWEPKMQAQRRPISSDDHRKLSPVAPRQSLQRVPSGLLNQRAMISTPRRTVSPGRHTDQHKSPPAAKLSPAATVPLLPRVPSGLLRATAQASHRGEHAKSARTTSEASLLATPVDFRKERAASARAPVSKEHRRGDLTGTARASPEKSSLTRHQESSLKSGTDNSAVVSWSLQWSLRVGEDLDTINFSVPVLVLDQNVIFSVNQAIEDLNKGNIHCAEGLCLAYSLSGKGWYLLYRNGRKDLASSALHRSEADPAVSPNVQGPDLGPGVAVMIQECTCKVVAPLGMGSFGAVWAAERLDGGVGEVAIKEIYCGSKTELSNAMYEGKLINLLSQERDRKRSASASTPRDPRQAHSIADTAAVGGVDNQLAASGEAAANGHAGDTHALDRIPAFVACQTDSLGSAHWRVRLAMTKVPGVPLERFLESHREQSFANDSSSAQCQRFAQACNFSRQLIGQLAPTFQKISNHAYHRDINSFNILVDGGNSHLPRFGLVDFGLAVDGESWRGADVSPSSWHLVDIGGDCRYWPMSAWLQFECGWKEVLKYPTLCAEYQMQLDFHAMGITALQALAAMSPSEPAADGQSEEALPQEVWTLRRAWDKYWKDVTHFWERLLNCFRNKGDQFALKGQCIEEGVHNIVGADLAKVRDALREVYGACTSSTDASLVDSGPLFAALLELVSAGGIAGVVEDMHPLSWQAVHSVVHFGDVAAAGNSSRRQASPHMISK